MNDWIQWGLEVVRAIQTIRNPALDQFFLTINFLGDAEFYLIFFPVLFWCFSKSVGYRLAGVFLFSSFLNETLKAVFAQPRPYQVDKNLWAPVQQPGYGIPSGHTQNTLTTWGNLATQLRRRGWWALAFAIPLSVGFGRMYLADHFPQDVIAGAILGVALVAGYAVLEPPATRWIIAQSLARKLALAVLAPLALALVFFSVKTAVPIGAMLGFFVGAILEERYVRFSPRGAWWQHLLKFALGVAIGLGLRVALKPLLGETPVGDTIRYAIIGVWFALGAPWVFVLARLAKRA